MVWQVTSDQSRHWPTGWGNHAALEKQGAEQPLTTGGIAGSICQGDQVEERDDLRRGCLFKSCSVTTYDHFSHNRTSTPSLNIPCHWLSVAANCQAPRCTFSSPAINAGPWFSASLRADQEVRPRSWGSCASMLCIPSCMSPRCFPAALECSHFSQTGVLLCHFSFLARGSPRTFQYIHVYIVMPIWFVLILDFVNLNLDVWWSAHTIQSMCNYMQNIRIHEMPNSSASYIRERFEVSWSHQLWTGWIAGSTGGTVHSPHPSRGSRTCLDWELWHGGCMLGC